MYKRPGWTKARARVAGLIFIAAAAAGLAQANDTVAPTLLSFDAAAAVDVTLETNPLVVKFKATDDVSGLLFGGAKAYGPSGR